ncbi:MAG: hypothetical protein GX417_01655, partial [Clostridiales bacterium]|nr:hypothetical protein [Clostridiales bacterium]
GMINVLSEVRANGGKEIKSFGIDIDDTITQAINDGVITGTLVQNSAAMGYISMLTLKYMAEGYRIADGVYAIDSGCAVVTKDNIDNYQPALDAVRDSIIAELTTKYLVKD